MPARGRHSVRSSRLRAVTSAATRCSIRIYNGTTVGQVQGPVTFIPNKGARLETVGSYIRYTIPVTITSGEFSMEIEGLRANAPGDKSKVFGMMSGTADYITDPYRVDVQYRGTGGSPPNSITYRVLYGVADDLSVRYEPTTDQRLSSVRNLDPNTTYFWKYTWGKTVRVHGPAGRTDRPDDLRRHAQLDQRIVQPGPAHRVHRHTDRPERRGVGVDSRHDLPQRVDRRPAATVLGQSAALRISA